MKVRQTFSFALFLAVASLVGASALADVVTLQNGRTYIGRYMGGTTQTIRFRAEGAVKTFRISEIGRIDFGTDTPTTVSSPTSRTYPRVPVRDQYAIPTGTVLRIRTNENIDSESANVGDTFTGTLDQDLLLGSQLLAERGSPATLRIAEVEEAGAFAGRPSLVIELVEMTIGNAAYALTSTQIEERGSSQSKRTGAVVGGGAALGALIGAIAGGGKGAAIGAVVGGATGAGYQVLTKGEKLKIPAETVLEFTLQNELVLRR
jgi:hypothetical protein